MSGRLLAAVAAAGLLVALTDGIALDYGASAENSSTVRFEDDTDLEQKDRVSIWLTADITPATVFDARGAYRYADDRPYLFDLEQLSVTGRLAERLGPDSVLRYAGGRFSDRATSVLVFDHTVDGARGALSYPGFRVGLGAGYTGLLLKPVANVSMSAADVIDEDDDDVYLAPRRLISHAWVGFPEVVGRQSVTVWALAQFDFRKDEDLRINTQYGGLELTGPVIPSLYYDVSGTLETGRDEETDTDVLALLAAGGLRYYKEPWLFSRFVIRGLWASGDSGELTPFIPVSAPTLGLAYEPQLQDLIQLDASYSLKPLARSGAAALENIQLFFRTAARWAAADNDYLGTEVGGGINARPFSDLGASISTAFWMPDVGDNVSALRIEASLAF
jgi:hypothetical protein